MRPFRLPAIAVLLLAVLSAPAWAQKPTQARQRQPRNYRAAPRNQIIFRYTGPKAEVDLRPEIERLGLGIRDQGNRGTCSVFATTFLIEYHTARQTKTNGLQLSEEYLNWAKNRANNENKDGGFFTEIIAGYKGYGIVPSTEMPYQAAFHPKHPDKPKPKVIHDGQVVTRYPFTFIKDWDNTKGMTAAELEATKNALRSGHPVATGIWWLENFETVTVGKVPLLKQYPRKDNAGSNPPMFDGHSIDLVGFHEGSQFPGGGYFIFRNSFGTGFGDDGYGYVSFQYIRDYANDAISIEKKE
jgi:C1A family cysteine protease